MTVYNEAEFVDYAIKSCLPYVDNLVIVEGAYQETISCGANPRSTDATIEIIEKYKYEHNVHILYSNEKSDKDQRNVGLSFVKKLNNNSGWCLIIDGDEVYSKENFVIIKNITKLMKNQNKYAAYFASLTFVNDLMHYTNQEFPRLFKITPGCLFIDDNYMKWENAEWTQNNILKIPYVKYHHYAFCKNNFSRFNLKKEWWETRFGKNYHNTGKPFEYDWYLNDDGKIYSPNHTVRKYVGAHPLAMKDHPKWKESYLIKCQIRLE
jgi:hypothetical protein